MHAILYSPRGSTLRWLAGSDDSAKHTWFLKGSDMLTAVLFVCVAALKIDFKILNVIICHKNLSELWITSGGERERPLLRPFLSAP